MAELKCKKCGAILNDDNCDELYNAVERLYTDLIAKIKEID